MSIIEYIISDIFLALLWESTEVVAMVVFLANTFTIWLPNTSKNKHVQKFLTFLNRLSLNLHRNLNAPDWVVGIKKDRDTTKGSVPPRVKGSDD